jgi:FkbM family methyltransferase
MKLFDIKYEKADCKFYITNITNIDLVGYISITDLQIGCVYFTCKVDIPPNHVNWILPIMNDRLVRVIKNNTSDFAGFSVKFYNENMRLLFSEDIKLGKSSKIIPFFTDPFDANGASYIHFFHTDLCSGMLFDGVVVDAGANNGFFTLLAKKNGAKRIYAIEPDPLPYHYLSKSFYNDDTVILFNGVLHTNNEPQSFNVSLNCSLGSSMNYKTDQSMEIISPSIMLDDILKIERRIDMLKIDIEGNELSVIQSLHPTQYDRINQFFIEFHNGSTELYNILTNNGYVVEYRHSNEYDTAGFLYAIKSII